MYIYIYMYIHIYIYIHTYIERDYIYIYIATEACLEVGHIFHQQGPSQLADFRPRERSDSGKIIDGYSLENHQFIWFWIVFHMV